MACHGNGHCEWFGRRETELQNTVPFSCLRNIKPCYNRSALGDFAPGMVSVMPAHFSDRIEMGMSAQQNWIHHPAKETEITNRQAHVP
jgi:hypothetical protein